jgi:hypothetical protein
MEAIIDYKVKDFLKLQDWELVTNYLTVLELLKPLKTIPNPNYNKYKFWDKKTFKIIEIKDKHSLLFGEVAELRMNFNLKSIESVFDSLKLVTGLSDKQINGFTITTFYGIINNIKQELIEMSNMEINTLTDENPDINLEQVNANARIKKFGVFNTIDSLAKEDVLKWDEINKLPYMTVFTKLSMDKVKNDIQKELKEIQDRKNKLK